MEVEMLTLFAAVFGLAALLSLSTGGLVIASLFIAGRATNASQFVLVTLVVGAVFLGLGLLLAGIARRGVAILRTVRREGTDTLSRNVSFLAAYLICGGTALCLILGGLSCGILARINQGVAVFG